MCDLTPLPLHSMSASEKRGQHDQHLRILEKRIEVPGIVLTEADDDYDVSCSPTPTGRKQVVLLNPCTVYGPRVRPTAPTARSLVILILVLLAAYHLWTHLDLLHVQVPQAAVPL
ncbi:hypothetical protein A1Q2_04793 [Trichosporon asahii var. asahii CBS 8904]|uniref:Uncharacterized protein n=2 Tax=Trichosporon asahii var. asahii TaxID=189963 RepID=K1VA75_TRIAC|nr:hypothetical protein A1Q1_00803 [Trichosporon asahii var. asahii CBS 2479]EJT52898.1 hypothetical protein A1Q1_00803 [Trichosporon asahii var. asahii CBS 2479]EKD00920.1 hypothetical protein A1Q2_04793 [Trichosporon asahii var. asahii CBS 8904]